MCSAARGADCTAQYGGDVARDVWALALRRLGGLPAPLDGRRQLPYPCDGEDVIVGNSTEANADHLLYGDGRAIFNEQGLDADCRIEGDTDASLLYTDAGNNRVGIGTSSPPCKLNVIQSGGGVVTTDCVLSVENSGSSNSGCAIDVLAGSSGTAGIVFGTRSNLDVGHWVADGATGECTFATSSLKIDCGQKVKRTAVSGTNTVLTTDYYLGIDTGSGVVALTLPSASSAGAGRVYVFAVETGANNATISRSGSDSIYDGGPTPLTSLTVSGKAHTVSLICTGSEWIVTAKN